MKRYDMAVAMYMEECRALGLSPCTLRNYSTVLAAFGSFLDARGLAPDAGAVVAWRNSLAEGGAKVATIRQYLITLRAFFNAVEDDAVYPGCGMGQPVTKRMMPRERAKAPYGHLLPEEAIRKLYTNKCPSARLAPTWERNYAIVMLLIDSKIRNAELLDLTREDVDLDRRELIVRCGKGGKYRVADLTEISTSAIRLYIASSQYPDGLPDDAPLFGVVSPEDPSWHKGTGIWLSRLVERHVRIVTGLEGFRTHSMRHAGAVLDLNAGASLEQLQSGMGHSSVTTTEIYAGRLQHRKRREEAAETIKIRDAWAAENAARIAAV